MNDTTIQLLNKVKKIVIMTSVIPTIFKSYLFYLNQWLVVYPFKKKEKKTLQILVMISNLHQM